MESVTKSFTSDIMGELTRTIFRHQKYGWCTLTILFCWTLRRGYFWCLHYGLRTRIGRSSRMAGCNFFEAAKIALLISNEGNYVWFFHSGAIAFRFMDEYDLDFKDLVKSVEKTKSSCQKGWSEYYRFHLSENLLTICNAMKYIRAQVKLCFWVRDSFTCFL